MKAVTLRDVTPAEQVYLEEISIPKVRPGWVLIRVKGFGAGGTENIA
ncbi:MAG: hypothetical protein GX083_04875 [Clostridiales bacterium]|nr:hypothetical protein [Clostridiales bacterium]